VLVGDVERALRLLGGLRAEGAEATLVLWALLKAMRDLWGTVTGGTGATSRGWPRPSAGLEKGARRAARLPFTALSLRAGRADRMIKGRLLGNAWDEMALLVLDLCGRPAARAAQSVLK
jgi:DNA polymerase-3 subunit delta